MNSHPLYDASRLFSASKLSFPPCMIIFKVNLDLELLPIVDLVFVPFCGPVGGLGNESRAPFINSLDSFSAWIWNL